MRRGGPAAVVALSLAICAPVSAQGASPYIPLDHWAYRALVRLDGLGLLSRYDPTSRAVPVKDVRRYFEEASAGATPEMADLVEGYRARFEEETGTGVPVDWMGGGAERAGSSGLALVYANATAAYGGEAGAIRPGIGGFEETDWTGPSPVPTTTEAFANAGAGVAVGPIAGRAAVRASGTEVSVEEVYGVLAAGPAGVWFGRRPWAYQASAGGGLVLDSVRLDGGGFVLRPVGVPWIGDVGFQTTVSRAADNGWIGRPWFWTTRFSIRPHPRLAVGFTRAAMFGGERNVPVTADRLWKVFIGKHVAPGGSGFENQVSAIDVRYRPPVSVPTVLRLEWGFEDSAGAISEQPAITAGLDVAAIPGFPEVAAGVEYTRISGRSLGHWVWYRHWWFHEGWTDGGANLGHPLGGHGTELRVFGTADLADAALLVSSQLFVRDRGEDNIYAPDREGRSTGVVVKVDWRFFQGFELTGAVSWEEGTGWRDRSGDFGIRWVGGVGRP